MLEAYSDAFVMSTKPSVNAGEKPKQSRVLPEQHYDQSSSSGKSKRNERQGKQHRVAGSKLQPMLPKILLHLSLIGFAWPPNSLESQPFSIKAAWKVEAVLLDFTIDQKKSLFAVNEVNTKLKRSYVLRQCLIIVQSEVNPTIIHKRL